MVHVPEQEKPHQYQQKWDYSSRFNMGAYDFELIYHLKAKAYEASFAILTIDQNEGTDIYRECFAALKNLYKPCRTILPDNIRLIIDNGFNELMFDIQEIQYLESMDINTQEIRFTTVIKFELLHEILMDLFQVAGLGIDAEKRETLKKKIDRAMLLKK